MGDGEDDATRQVLLAAVRGAVEDLQSEWKEFQERLDLRTPRVRSPRLRGTRLVGPYWVRYELHYQPIRERKGKDWDSCYGGYHKVLCAACGWQPSLVLRVVRRLQAATEYLRRRSDGLDKCASDQLEAQSSALEALSAEAAAAAARGQ